MMFSMKWKFAVSSNGKRKVEFPDVEVIQRARLMVQQHSFLFPDSMEKMTLDPKVTVYYCS